MAIRNTAVGSILASWQWWRWLINDVQSYEGCIEKKVTHVGPACYLDTIRNILQGVLHTAVLVRLVCEMMLLPGHYIEQVDWEGRRRRRKDKKHARQIGSDSDKGLRSGWIRAWSHQDDLNHVIWNDNEQCVPFNACIKHGKFKVWRSFRARMPTWDKSPLHCCDFTCCSCALFIKLSPNKRELDP